MKGRITIHFKAFLGFSKKLLRNDKCVNELNLILGALLFAPTEPEASFFKFFDHSLFFAMNIFSSNSVYFIFLENG